MKQENPILATLREEPQHIPANTATVPPIQAAPEQKMTDKQRKKLEKEREENKKKADAQKVKARKNFLQGDGSKEAKASAAQCDKRMKEILDELKVYEAEHKLTNPNWAPYGNSFDTLYAQKNYGGLCTALEREKIGKNSPAQRRIKFNEDHPEYSTHMQGITRDATLFLDANDDTPDELIKKTIDNEIIIDKTTSAPEAVDEAKKQLAKEYDNLYIRANDLFAKVGIDMNKPVKYASEIPLIAEKVIHLFKFAQVGSISYLGKRLIGYVPPEKLAFIDALYMYTRHAGEAADYYNDSSQSDGIANGILYDGDLDFPKLFEKSMADVQNLIKQKQQADAIK
ncbi:MAG: hypothetical protein LBN34_03610 [Clostridiales Family XIII bacterium]|nr:hypothetical protein [Clostridiales Family XIII bacterium]